MTTRVIKLFPECHILGYLLLYFASCVNPIIYVIMNKQYRQAYAGVIGCSWIRASLTPYGSSAPGAGGLQAHQPDYVQGNFKQRHAVTLTKLWSSARAKRLLAHFVSQGHHKFAAFCFDRHFGTAGQFVCANVD